MCQTLSQNSFKTSHVKVKHVQNKENIWEHNFGNILVTVFVALIMEQCSSVPMATAGLNVFLTVHNIETYTTSSVSHHNILIHNISG